MSSPYLGEIKMVGFSFAPKGWATCDGQTMPINQNQALYSLLGTTYGGNGQTTFNLPDLRGRTTLGVGTQGGNSISWGQSGGEELHTLTNPEMPSHTHTATATAATASAPGPAGNFWANGVSQYAASPLDTAMAPNAIANAGSGQAHENRSPYLVISFIIALQGIFPTRN